jgi:hypothetical protein
MIWLKKRKDKINIMKKKNMKKKIRDEKTLFVWVFDVLRV